jgi:hypothetical protein
VCVLTLVRPALVGPLSGWWRIAATLTLAVSPWLVAIGVVLVVAATGGAMAAERLARRNSLPRPG